MALPLLFLIAGIFLAPCLDPKPVWICLAFTILLGFAQRRCLLLSVLLLGAGLSSLDPLVPAAPGEMPVRLAGVLRRPPEWRGLGVYLDVELQSIDARPVRGKARLTEFLDDPDVRRLFDELELGTGDRLEILVKLNRPVVYRNPGGFDYRRHLERQGIYWTGTIRNPRLITVLDRGWHGPDRIKRWIHDRVEAPFRNDRTGTAVRGLVAGMVLGRNHGLTAEAERQFQAGGLYHLVVVSGFNLAVVAGAAFWLARRFPWKRRSRLLFVLVFALAYAAVVEGQTPVLRATLMVSVMVAGRLLDRGYAVMNAIATTAFAILVADPNALEDSSFQMSFAAVLAVTCIGVPAAQWALGWLREALRDFEKIARDTDLPIEVVDWRVSRRAWCELHGLPSWTVTAPWRVALITGEMAIVAVAVETVFVVFMVESFHRISPVSPLLNIPAGLIAAAVTPMGLLLIVLPAPLAAAPAWVISRLLELLLTILELGLALPGATMRVPSPPYWMWLLYAGVGAVAVLAIHRRWTIVCLSTVAGIVVLQATIAIADFPPSPPRDVTITFLDVGQGDSTLVEFPSGERMLIDGGGAAAGRFLALRDESTFSIGESVVSAYLFSRGIRRLERVVLTHAHYDHMDGLFDVIENFHIGEFWIGRNPMIPRYRELIERIQEKQIPMRWVAAGQRIGPWEVLHPPSHWRVKRTAQNDDSVVLKLEAAGRTALFAGDLERNLEVRPATATTTMPTRSGQRGRDIVVPASGGQPAVAGFSPRLDLLKVSHHGSKGVRFRPEARVKVISVGANNPFGHPHESALPALRTDRLGAIRVTLGAAGPEIYPALTKRCPSCTMAFLLGSH